MTFRASIITLYPEMFPGSMGMSLAGNALERGDWSLETIPLREFGEGKHQRVDDTPAGGGAGMVLKPDVLGKAIDSLGKDNRPRLLMSPRGKPLTQERVRQLADGDGVVIVCGRFEGVDQRVIDGRSLEEVSIGDYILSGGEPAATVLIDAIVRLLPGVMGNESSGTHESFENNLLEHPHYTRPQEWEGKRIPAILTSGNHGKIAEWQQEQAEILTAERRPDLAGLTKELREQLIKLEESLWIAETRYDDAYMDQILAAGFVEFGRSGKRYERSEMFLGGYAGQVIECKIPIPKFEVEMLGNSLFLISYMSVLNRGAEKKESANRSSIWKHDAFSGWKLIFHQGTPIHD